MLERKIVSVATSKSGPKIDRTNPRTDRSLLNSISSAAPTAVHCALRRDNIDDATAIGVIDENEGTESVAATCSGWERVAGSIWLGTGTSR